MSDDRLLVTGFGLVARALVAAAAERGIETLVASRSSGDARADLTAADGAFEKAVERFEPDVVIHTAAETSVARCEREVRHAYAANVVATRRVVRAAEATGAAVIALSTDWVFGGDAAPYREEAAPAPRNVYGLTKAWAEEPVLVAGGAVVRGTFLGRRPDGRQGFVERLLEDERPAVPAVRRARPLWVGHAAELLLDLAGRREGGVWHVGSADSVDWRDLARLIRRGTGLGAAEPVMLNDGIDRPADTSLATAKLEAALDRTMPSTAETVAAMLAMPALGAEVRA